jgi:3-phosphoshikimate 1-carboxyvinyltransferase
MDMIIPGDFSSASFFLALGACHKNASIMIKNVSLNPSRTAFFKVLQMMGADVEILQRVDDIEPYGIVVVRSSELRGIEVPIELIPNMIDEVPLVALLACFADGKTVVKNAFELRVKESDRIAILCKNMKSIGVEINETADGFEIEGKQKIKGGIAESHHDHRMAMLFSICGLLSEEGVELVNPECCSISFPTFFELLKEITREGIL